MIPCAFILMANRRRRDYVKILRALVREAKTSGLNLRPETIMTDFETAAIMAFQSVKKR